MLPVAGHVTVAPARFAPAGRQPPAAVIEAPVSTHVNDAPLSVTVRLFVSRPRRRSCSA